MEQVKRVSLTLMQLKCNKDGDRSSQFCKYPSVPLQVTVLDHWSRPSLQFKHEEVFVS